MWHIYFIMWITGAWKWTLIANIKKVWHPKIHIPLSYKSRSIRPNEVHGVDSYFVSKEDFVSAIEKGEFLEYAIVHETDYYGTKYEDVLDNGVYASKITIKEIDIHGLKRLKKERPELDSVYSTIFLNIPPEKLKERVEARGVFMSDEEYERRVKSSLYEEEEIMKYCDFVVDATLSPDEVLEQFLKIIHIK